VNEGSETERNEEKKRTPHERQTRSTADLF